MNVGPSELLLVIGVVLVPVALFVLGWSRIFAKAGWPGATAFLMLVPLVNIVLFFVFAFGDWPVLRQVRSLRGGVP